MIIVIYFGYKYIITNINIQNNSNIFRAFCRRINLDVNQFPILTSGIANIEYPHVTSCLKVNNNNNVYQCYI